MKRAPSLKATPKRTSPTKGGPLTVHQGKRRGGMAIRAAAYEAAGSGRRAKGWTASSLGPNSILSTDADLLRRRSHDLMRQNPWAFSGLESFVANCVGTGIKPHSRASELSFRSAAHELWNDWVSEADAAGLTDFYGLTSLACRSVVEGGECFVRLRERRPEDGLSVPLQLQLLEAEHVPTNKNERLPNGNMIRCGIEFDLIGRRVAYWMYRVHPGEAFTEMGANTMELVRVPAENILHLYRPLRPGQIRGEPWLARVLIRLYELDQLDDAKLVKQKVAALFAGFITSTGSDLTGLLGETDPDADGVSLAGLEPGIMQILNPGQTVSFSDPPDTGDDSGNFAKYQQRGCAAGMNVPYANLTGDVSDANYSSLRSAIIEFRRRAEMFVAGTMTFQFCRPVWQRWMTLAVLNGGLDARGFLKDQRGYLRAKWIGQGWQWVDPLKEVQAAKLSVRAGFKSRSSVIIEMGEDPEQVDDAIAADNERADRLGLIFDSDPRKVTDSGKINMDTGAPEPGGPSSPDQPLPKTPAAVAFPETHLHVHMPPAAEMPPTAPITVNNTVQIPPRAPMKKSVKINRDGSKLMDDLTITEELVSNGA